MPPHAFPGAENTDIIKLAISTFEMVYICSIVVLFSGCAVVNYFEEHFCRIQYRENRQTNELAPDAIDGYGAMGLFRLLFFRD